MKKGLIAGCALLAAMFACADMDDLRITFKTAGVDTYADGKTVLDGEFYALVWVANGSAFQGFKADATPVAETGNELIVMVPFAKDGRLPLTYKQIASALAPRYADGAFIVTLLDTRNADGTLSGFTLDAKGTAVPKAINGYSTVAEISGEAALYSAALKLDLPVAVNAASAVPADAPRPVITGITLRDGKNGREAVLKVKGTAAYLRYVAASSDKPALSTADKLPETAVNGDADAEKEIEIVVPAAKESDFYSIMRK